MLEIKHVLKWLKDRGQAYVVPDGDTGAVFVSCGAMVVRLPVADWPADFSLAARHTIDGRRQDRPLPNINEPWTALARPVDDVWIPARAPSEDFRGGWEFVFRKPHNGTVCVMWENCDGQSIIVDDRLTALARRLGESVMFHPVESNIPGAADKEQSVMVVTRLVEPEDRQPVAIIMGMRHDRDALVGAMKDLGF